MAKEKITDLEIDKISKETGKELKDGGKVKIKIPKDPQNPQIESVPVCINGYLYQIKVGVSVEVPEEVERILSNAGYI